MDKNFLTKILGPDWDKLVERSVYTDEIKGFFDKEPVKVLTGMRRSGKSQILKLSIIEALKYSDADHIIYINFEDYDYEHLLELKALNNYIKDKMNDEKRYYIFLDEIQMVKGGWEKVVNSLRLKNTDIFITGSNSKLLSGELATVLTGRTADFLINPLCFGEFISFRKKFGLKGFDIDDYIRVGGFPMLSVAEYRDEDARKMVAGIHSQAVLQDVINRHKVKNVALLKRIIAFIYDNVGSLTSLRSIEKFIKNEPKGSGDIETIGNYIGHLEEAHIIRKASRYDIKGRQLMSTDTICKYYLADHSLQYVLRDMQRTNSPGILENIVYNDLIRRGYKVYVGKLDDKEIDFIAEKINGTGKVYVQVCVDFAGEGTLDREFNPLVEIKDSYPKYVVTMDKHWNEDRNGVRGIHIKDFLLKENL